MKYRMRIGNEVSSTPSGINGVTSYLDYFNAPQQLNKSFNVIVLDGRIRPQLALAVFFILNQNAIVDQST